MYDLLKYPRRPTINLSESRRTLAALRADLPYHELQGDRLAVENAAMVAEGYLRRMTRPDDAADSVDWWRVRGLAVELLRAAGEAEGRLDAREARARLADRRRRPCQRNAGRVPADKRRRRLL